MSSPSLSTLPVPLTPKHHSSNSCLCGSGRVVLAAPTASCNVAFCIWRLSARCFQGSSMLLRVYRHCLLFFFPIIFPCSTEPHFLHPIICQLFPVLALRNNTARRGSFFFFFFFNFCLQLRQQIRKVEVKSLSRVRLFASLQGSSVHGIFQARVLEWVAMSFSMGSSRPRDRTWVSRIAGRRFTL